MAEIITKGSGFRAKDVHPTKSAGRKFDGKDAPVIPGISEKTANESRFVRCKQCGFICDRIRDKKGNGWGNESTEDITIIAGGTAHAKDPIVNAGCPFCGSSEYE